MPPSAAKKTVPTAVTANLTVRLDKLSRDRLNSLAEIKKRTPHYIMREAIQKYLADEESELRFIDASTESWADYERTGNHITLDEAKQWAKKLKAHPDSLPPQCHE